VETSETPRARLEELVRMENLFELVRRHAEQSADKIAVAKWSPGSGCAETAYGELLRKVNSFTGLLAQLTPQQPMIPMLVGKSADSIACMLAAIALGRRFCFVSTKYRGPQIAAVLAAADSPVCIVDATGLLALKQAWKDQPSIGRTTWVVLDGPAPDDLRGAANVIGVDDKLHQEEPQIVTPHHSTGNAAGACLFTSGSTGQPKGVLIDEADLMRRVATEIAWFGLTASDVLLSVLPFSFDVGLNQLMTALGVGGELVVLDSWLPADILRVAAERRVTGISAVPSIWQDTINAGARFDTNARHASLRYITVSGGSLSRAALQRLPEIVGTAGVFKTYGQTEAFRATSLRPEDYHRKLDSVGKPFPGVHVYVVRDDGSRCDAGEVGEVVHTGLGIMMGYLGNADQTTKLRENPFRGKEDSSPFAVFTGDVGYFDDDGYLFLKGRRDSMLKVTGNRVYPQEVTNQIMTIPGVRDAVVVGVKQDDGQMRLVAFLTIAPGVDVSAGAVRKMLHAKLPAFMVPKDIVFVGHMPRTASGKVDERRLVEAANTGAQLG
jgi:acyl-CoA synthetase (AMP-forming)/AMP-acid ligase II